MAIIFVSVDLGTILPPLIVAAIVGLVVWRIQAWFTTKEARRLKDEADRAKEKEASALERARTLEAEKQRVEQEHQKLVARVSTLEAQGNIDAQTLQLLKQETLPMIEATKRKLVELLTHPGDEFIIPDALLEKVVQVGVPLTPDEKSELNLILLERQMSTNPHVSDIEKAGAKALMPIIELSELEAEHATTAVITAVQLVTSTFKSPATKKAEEVKG